MKSSSDYLQKMYSEMARVDEQLEMVSRCVRDRFKYQNITSMQRRTTSKKKCAGEIFVKKYLLKNVSGLRRTEGVCPV